MSDTARGREIDAGCVNTYAELCPEKLVRLSEYRYELQLYDIANRALAEKGTRALLLAGPSASSKTTTAQKLREMLELCGREARIISIDDFFLGLECLPVLPDGSYDMETLDGVDVELAQECFRRLLEDGRAELPEFDFGTQSRSARTREVELGQDGIVIIEGTHALNPAFSERLPQVGTLRVCTGAGTGFYSQGAQVFSPRDVRLARRIVRDQLFRGWSAEKTLMQWGSVCAGEERFIDPYTGLADMRLDSTLDYEPAVLRGYVEPLLGGIDEGSRFYGAALELREKYGHFDPLPPEMIPKESLLREFVGVTNCPH